MERLGFVRCSGCGGLTGSKLISFESGRAIIKELFQRYVRSGLSAEAVRNKFEENKFMLVPVKNYEILTEEIVKTTGKLYPVVEEVPGKGKHVRVPVTMQALLDSAGAKRYCCRATLMTSSYVVNYSPELDMMENKEKNLNQSVGTTEEVSTRDKYMDDLSGDPEDISSDLESEDFSDVETDLSESSENEESFKETVASLLPKKELQISTSTRKLPPTRDRSIKLDITITSLVVGKINIGEILENLGIKESLAQI
jgi:hypothetical protein